MKRPNKGGKRVVPQSGGESFHQGESAPLVYSYPMPPVKSRGRLVPVDGSHVDDGGSPAVPVASGENVPHRARPLVPASEDVAKLPRTAREAFVARCAARVARLRAGVTSPEAAAALILAAATVETPVRRQLLCVRRDFDRIARLVKDPHWTDDTPVPPDVFGPMWPAGRTPHWAEEPPAASPPRE